MRTNSGGRQDKQERESRGHRHLLAPIFAIWFVLSGGSAETLINTSKIRTMERFKSQCDEGNGKACFDYGRALWSTPGATDRKQARVYIERGCELKYKAACDSPLVRQLTFKRERRVASAGPGGPCFSSEDLSDAIFTESTTPGGTFIGERIDSMAPGSFWLKTGMVDGDAIQRINNLGINSRDDITKAFSTAGKNYNFQVFRKGSVVTLFYSCK